MGVGFGSKEKRDLSIYQIQKCDFCNFLRLWKVKEQGVPSITKKWRRGGGVPWGPLCMDPLQVFTAMHLLMIPSVILNYRDYCNHTFRWITGVSHRETWISSICCVFLIEDMVYKGWEYHSWEYKRALSRDLRFIYASIQGRSDVLSKYYKFAVTFCWLRFRFSQ